jgi:hypothetical protein
LKALVRPGITAFLACALAAALHPRLRVGLGADEPASLLVASLSLLLTLAYVLRGLGNVGLGRRLLGLGALALVTGLALDGARAHRGLLTLDEGQTKNNFEEQGAGGRALGLRPFGFELKLTGVTGSVATLERRRDGARITVTASRAASLGPFRFADPQLIPTGQARRLTVTTSDESGTRSAEVSPGEPGRLGDLEIELERYFPDFALDDHQQPFTRSPHSRNPAALLRVRRGERAFRVFVIRSMPGLHQVPELHQSFGLGDVTPELSAQLRVAEEPAAPLVGMAALLVLAGVLRAGSQT